MPKGKHIYLVLLISKCLYSYCFAADLVINVPVADSQPFAATAMQVMEPHEFYGLAGYYNDVGTYWLTETESARIERLIPQPIGTKNWLAQVGRFNVQVWDLSELDFSDANDDFNLNALNLMINESGIQPQILNKSELKLVAPELDKIRYQHLWSPLSYLTRFIETCLLKINSLLENWGLSIILYCLLVKILFIPLSLLTTKLQRQTGLIKSTLEPKLVEIKSLYDGEEAHNRIMSAHKELGVGPFYSLKPLLSTLIQIPILISTFNALGEMPQIDGSQFLWIDNLAYPDKILSLPFVIPMLGNELNFLPILMTFVSIVATVMFTNNYDSSRDIAKQKRNLYFMAGAFFLLFYPFPACMVLYWMTSNALHIAQQKVIK